MYKCILFLVSIICGVETVAQELIIKEFVHLETDLSARAVNSRRYDANGNLCALVKVEFAAPDSKFDGYVIGDVSNANSTYWVYMCGKNPASRHMSVSVDGFLPLNVYFADYGISSLEEGETYKLTISIPDGFSFINAKRTPKNLAIACVKEDNRYFFTDEEWCKLDERQKSEYSILGLTVVDSGHEYIIALRDASNDPVEWGYPQEEFQTLQSFSNPVDDFDGMINTSKMIGDGLKWGIQYPCATLARDYKAYPGDKTIWFLPSAGEMNLIVKNMDELTPLLKKYGGEGFSNYNEDGSWNPVGHWRWTSTVDDNTKYAYALSGTSFKGGRFGRMEMSDKNKVRPITFASEEVIDSSDKWRQMLQVLCYSKKLNNYDYYDDMTLSNLIKDDKSKDLIPVGIVLTDGNHSFILAMKDAVADKVLWGPAIDIDGIPNITKEREVYADMNGLENTESMRKYAKTNNLHFPVLDAVDSYKTFRGDRISWYIPSSGELLIVDANKKYINGVLENLIFLNYQIGIGRLLRKMRPSHG